MPPARSHKKGRRSGKLAGSVIRGLLRAKFCAPGEIIASEPFDETRNKLKAETGVNVTTANTEVAEKAETIFIGVKPGVVLTALRESNLGRALNSSVTPGLSAT